MVALLHEVIPDVADVGAVAPRAVDALLVSAPGVGLGDFDIADGLVGLPGVEGSSRVCAIAAVAPSAHRVLITEPRGRLRVCVLGDARLW